MPKYIPGTTQRLNQLTGDYDPDGKPHYNFTGKWGCLGTDLGANSEHDDATFIFFGDTLCPGPLQELYNNYDAIAFIDHPDFIPGSPVACGYQDSKQQLDVFFFDGKGRLYVSWVHGRGVWQGPVRISDAGIVPPNANLATSDRVNYLIRDIYYIGNNSGLSVIWFDNDTLHKPWLIDHSLRGIPGGCVTTAHQVSNNQLDIFYIDKFGGLCVNWVVGTSQWHEYFLIDPDNLGIPGGGVAAAYQVDYDQIDVFFMDKDGRLRVSWVERNGSWNKPKVIDDNPVPLGIKGGKLAAAHQAGDNQLNVFFIGKDGALYVSWAKEKKPWHKPQRITNTGISQPGGWVSASYQVDESQLDVFFIGNDGGLYVHAVSGTNNWPPDPILISKPAIVPPGGCTAAINQMDNTLLDVFFIGNNNNLNVSAVGGKGKWQRPVNISDGFRLTPILENGVFYPFQIRNGRAVYKLPIESTATGAFSYDNKMFVFFFYLKNKTTFHSALSVSDDPFSARPYSFCFEFADQDIGKFWQVAPLVVRNSDYANLLPHDMVEPDGVFLFGHGYNATEGSNGVHLAFLPLKPGRSIDGSDLGRIWFYSKNAPSGWSKSINDTTLFFKTEGWSSISVGRVLETGHWIVLNQVCGGDDPKKFHLEGPIVARIAKTPMGIADAIPQIIFDPERDGAFGHYIFSDKYADINKLVNSIPNATTNPGFKHDGFAYGPYLLNHYTQWDKENKIITINYLLSTGKPYQVQVMRSSISICGDE